MSIAGRSYAKVYPGVYEIPAHSTVKVIDLPITPPDHEFYLTVTNGGDEGDDEYLTVFGSAAFETEVDAIRRMNRIRRTYLPFVERGDLPEAFVPPTRKGESSRGASFSIDLAGQPDRLVREAIRPVLELFQRLSAPEARVFICHASEDKPFARELALYLDQTGAEVWLDEWEIRVGESIVEKINAGLAEASHLIVLLSSISVSKPWVKREFSSALMRQLSSSSVSVLPILLDDCVVPAIMADIKYADCRNGDRRAFEEIRKAIFGERLSPSVG